MAGVAQLVACDDVMLMSDKKTMNSLESSAACSPCRKDDALLDVNDLQA
jgi:hypothetical protein